MPYEGNENLDNGRSVGDDINLCFLLYLQGQGIPVNWRGLGLPEEGNPFSAIIMGPPFLIPCESQSAGLLHTVDRRRRSGR